MDVMTFSEARTRLGAVMDRVVDDHAPVVVARRGCEAVVSLSDWRAIEETARLLSSPTNAARLAEAVSELDAGRLKPSASSSGVEHARACVGRLAAAGRTSLGAHRGGYDGPTALRAIHAGQL